MKLEDKLKNTKKLKKMLSKAERNTLTKIIVKWAMLLTTIYIVNATYQYYANRIDASFIITELIKYLVIGVIIGYMGKSGFEFYQNKKSEINSCTTEEEVTTNGSTTGPIG